MSDNQVVAETETERELLSLYRQIPPYDQKVVLGAARTFLAVKDIPTEELAPL